jgi:hypothetical protein
MSFRRHHTAALALALLALAVALPAAAGPNPNVTFVGPIESLPAGPGLIGDWTVAGRTVHVAASTAIDQSKGAPAVGVLVQVKGAPLADRSVDAREIKVLQPLTPRPRPQPQRVELAGVIAELPPGPPFVGDWTVRETTVHVAATTQIDESKGAVAVGAFVLVRGTKRDDGSIDAASIEVKRPVEPPRPQPRPECDFAVLHLTAAEAAPEGAEGVALTRLIVLPNGTRREDIKVAVEHLAPATTYDVVIDTVNAGVIVTNDEGEGHLFLSTADIPGAEPLPPEFQPVAERRHAEVSVAGAVVLAGDFVNARRVGCGQMRPDYHAVALLLDTEGASHGVAVAAIRGGAQTLRIAAWALEPGATVNAVADGIPLGTLTANADGTAHLALSSVPGAGQLPLPAAAVPVTDLLRVELQDAGGAVLAGGSLVPAAKP